MLSPSAQIEVFLPLSVPGYVLVGFQLTQPSGTNSSQTQGWLLSRHTRSLPAAAAPGWHSLVGTVQAAQIILTMVLLLPGKILCSRRGTCPELRMQVHGRARGRRICHREEAAPRQRCFLSQCSPGNWRKMRLGREETLKHFIVQECFFKRCC